MKTFIPGLSFQRHLPQIPWPTPALGFSLRLRERLAQAMSAAPKAVNFESETRGLSSLLSPPHLLPGLTRQPPPLCLPRQPESASGLPVPLRAYRLSPRAAKYSLPAAVSSSPLPSSPIYPHLPLPALPKDLHTSLFIHTRKTHLPQYSYHLRPRSLRDVLCRVALGSVLCSSDHACCLTRSSALLLLQRMRSSTTLTQTVGAPLLLHPPPPPFTCFPRLPRILDPAASRAAAAPWVSY